MILKIRDGRNLNWHVIDQIKRAAYASASAKRVKCVDALTEAEVGTWHFWRDGKWCSINLSENFAAINKEYPAWCMVDYHGGGEDTFVFDRAYLCNDNGKTIEVIH